MSTSITPGQKVVTFSEEVHAGDSPPLIVVNKSVLQEKDIKTTTPQTDLE